MESCANTRTWGARHAKPVDERNLPLMRLPFLGSGRSLQHNRAEGELQLLLRVSRLLMGVRADLERLLGCHLTTVSPNPILRTEQ